MKNSDIDDVMTADSIQDYFSRVVFAPENIFSNIPIIDTLPAEDYDPSEDGDYSDFLMDIWATRSTEPVMS